MAIATQNPSASLHSILTYQIKLPPSHPGCKIFNKCPTPRLLSFEYPPPPFFPTPLLLGTQE